MATGIVSIALNSARMYVLSNILFVINIFSFVILWVITILRLCFFRAALVRDLTHHGRAVTFLTTVAGTCVLGSQVAMLTPFIDVATALSRGITVTNTPGQTSNPSQELVGYLLPPLVIPLVFLLLDISQNDNLHILQHHQ